MAIIQCNRCGSDLNIVEGASTVGCKFCGSVQKVPQTEDGKLLSWQAETPIVIQNGPTVESYLERVFMFLEDGDWRSAWEYCERVLDIDPKNPRAYLGKLMVEHSARRPEALKECTVPFEDSSNYQRAMRFGDEKMRAELTELAEACRKTAEAARKDKILWDGKLIMSDHTLQSQENAIRLFASIPGWRDADAQIAFCKNKIEVLLAQAEADRLEQERQAELVRKAAEKRKKRLKRIAIVAACLSCVILVLLAMWDAVLLPALRYYQATAWKNEGNIRQAAVQFASLGDYRDAREQSLALWDQIMVRETVSAGNNHTAAVQKDGTVVAVGSNYDGHCNVSDWENIVAVSAGYNYTAGLRADGRVLAVGKNADSTRNVSGWTDVVAIDAGDWHTLGLRADGTVLAVGLNDDGQCNVSGWKDIVAVSAGYHHTVGLRTDGTVVAVGKNEHGECDVSAWTDIVAVSAGQYYTVGLRADGTAVAVGRNDYGQCNVSGWENIVAVSAGRFHTVGLLADGEVIAVGYNKQNQRNVLYWKDIVAVSAGGFHTVGLHADGTVVAIGTNDNKRCDVSGWTDIKTDGSGDPLTEPSLGQIPPEEDLKDRSSAHG